MTAKETASKASEKTAAKAADQVDNAVTNGAGNDTAAVDTPKVSARDLISQFHKKKVVALPTFKVTEACPLAVRITSEIRDGKVVDEKKKAARIVNVIDLVSGEEGQIVLGKVLEENLVESYPNDGYVGLCFVVEKQPKREGKEYFTYTIVEVDDPTA